MCFFSRTKLECQCISTIAFVKNEPELLDSPIWIMLINVVALEMLKAKMPDTRGQGLDSCINHLTTLRRNSTLRSFPSQPPPPTA